MKAAVMYSNSPVPRYEEIPLPKTDKEGEILVAVTAAALKHLDKGRATGTHYSGDAPDETGTVIGGDGVCVMPDGTRVYAIGISGMMADKAVIDGRRVVRLPDNLSDTDAAVLGNAVIGSAMGLRFKAKINKGDVVMINGATGFTGRVAVQIAKHYGAGWVISTGRNPDSLKALLELGADEVISLDAPDESIAATLARINETNPIDVVLDYLWGHSAELILASMRGYGRFTHAVRYVSIGSMTGDTISLSAANLRSVNLELTGSGLGSWSKEAVQLLFTEILPEMFQLAADGKLKVKTIEVELKDIGTLWNVRVPDGQRFVVKITSQVN